MVRRHHPPYIPVSSGFLYLVAIMDWASRHVLAWRLSNTMDSGFCVEALEPALRTARDLQHGPRSAVHQRGLHRPGRIRRYALLDGRSRAVTGQRLHRAAVALDEVRGRLCLRAERRVRRRAGDRRLADLLQAAPPALGAGSPHAGRSLPCGTAGVSQPTSRRGPTPAPVASSHACAAPSLRSGPAGDPPASRVVHCRLRPEASFAPQPHPMALRSIVSNAPAEGQRRQLRPRGPDSQPEYTLSRSSSCLQNRDHLIPLYSRVPYHIANGAPPARKRVVPED